MRLTRPVVLAAVLAVLSATVLWRSSTQSRVLGESLKASLAQNGVMAKSEFDLLMLDHPDGRISLAERTVAEMPADPTERSRWGAKLATVMLRLSLDKNLDAARKGRLAASARSLIAEGRSAGDESYVQDGIQWLGNVGQLEDAESVSPYLQASDPETRKLAESAMRELANART